MRFSANGYYLEEYTKCANCGVLLYGEPLYAEVEGATRHYCSQWCIDWDRERRQELAEARKAGEGTGA